MKLVETRRIEERVARRSGIVEVQSFRPVTVTYRYLLVSRRVALPKRLSEAPLLRWSSDSNRRFVLLTETKFGSRKSCPLSASVVDLMSEIALPTRPLTGNVARECAAVDVEQRLCVDVARDVVRHVENAVDGDSQRALRAAQDLVLVRVASVPMLVLMLPHENGVNVRPRFVMIRLFCELTGSSRR